MIIGVDFQPLVYGGSGGIIQWLSGVLDAFARRFPDDRLLVFTPDEFPRTVADLPSVRVITAPRERLHRVESAVLAAESADVLVRSYPQIESPDFPARRQIVAIPDMQHADLPENFIASDLRLRRLGFGSTLAGVGAVGTMTAFARDTVLRYPWTVCRDVFLMPPAVSFDAVADGTTGAPPWQAQIEALPGYFLYPANAWSHKNHRGLFAAFRAARPRLPAGMALVLTGACQERDRLVAGHADLPIVHLGYVDRRHLPLLYRRATALAFFSTYEGFGMPLLEAFHHDTPVACSDIPALAEVAGDAALRCDPTDVAAMAGALVRIAADQPLRAQAVAAGRRRLAAFDWTRSATALREAAGRVIERARRAPAAPAPVPAAATLPVSVVIDAAGDETAGAAAVGALLDQTHRPVEIVVVGAPRPAAAWAGAAGTGAAGDGRTLRLLDAAPAAAAGRAQAGLDAATAPLLLYLRSDCRAAPHALAAIAAHFAAHPACDVVVGATQAENPQGGVVARYAMPAPSAADIAEDSRRLPSFTFERHLAQLLAGDIRSVRPLVCWRRRIGALAGPLAPTLRHAFDLDYWFRLTDAGGALEIIGEPLATIALSADARSARQWSRVMAEIPRLLAPRGVAVDSAFFELMFYRRLGIEPGLRRVPRPVRALLNRVHRLLRPAPARDGAAPSGSAEN